MLMALAVEFSVLFHVDSAALPIVFPSFSHWGCIYLPTAACFYMYSVALSRLVAGSAGTGGSTRLSWERWEECVAASERMATASEPKIQVTKKQTLWSFILSSGQFAKWLQMRSTGALKRALLRYADWTYLNKEVWDTILIVLRVAQQRFSSLIGWVLFRQIRDNRDYRNASLHIVSSVIWREH